MKMSLDAFKDHFEGFLSGSGIIQKADGDVSLDFGPAFEQMFKEGIPVKVNVNKEQEVELIKHNG